MKPQNSITIKDSIIIGSQGCKGAEYKDISGSESCMKEAEQGIELLSKLKSVTMKDVADYNSFKELKDSVDRLTSSINGLQDSQEYLDNIQRNLEGITNEIPEMKGKSDGVLAELDSPLSTDHKLKIAIPILPPLVSYEIETDVTKTATEKMSKLKNLLLKLK